MIITKLQGGLGNQMFQAAAGYALAKFHNTYLVLDLSFLEKNKKSSDIFTARNYELDVFDYNFKFSTKKETSVFLSENKNYLCKFYRKIKGLILNTTILKDSWDSSGFFNKSSKYTYTDGYWQSENYFKNIRPEIINLFQFPNLSDTYKKTAKEIKESNSVSIHFRRGDYASNKHIKSVHGVCDVEYYEKAINFISKKQKNIKLFLFSDEPGWVNENFKTNFEFETINTNSSITDMHLMSLCKYNIIANSSFSWWGAWLNQNNEKLVVTPKEWFVNKEKNKTVKDLIPKKWKRT